MSALPPQATQDSSQTLAGGIVWIRRQPVRTGSTPGGASLDSYYGAGPVGATDPSDLVSDHEHHGTNRSTVPVKLNCDKVVPICAIGEGPI